VPISAPTRPGRHLFSGVSPFAYPERTFYSDRPLTTDTAYTLSKRTPQVPARPAIPLPLGRTIPPRDLVPVAVEAAKAARVNVN
jgi:hypothetical protein